MTTITIYTEWPVTEFDTGLDAVPTVLRTGTSIDETALTAVQGVAETSGVGIGIGTPPVFLPPGGVAPLDVAEETARAITAETALAEAISGLSGGGTITSVFGRTTAAITAQSGDYTAAQVGALPASAVGTGADAQVSGGLLTLSPTLNAEQLMRNQPINRLAQADGTLPMGGHGISNVANAFFNDLTPSHGVVNVLLNPPTLQLGDGTDAPDVILTRSTAGTLKITDGTASDGALVLSVGSPAVGLYANSGDAHPTASLGSVLGAAGVSLGPGGATLPDLFLLRTGAAAGTWTASQMKWQDGTAGHGLVALGLNPGILSIYGNSSDTQALFGVGSFGGAPGWSMGPGGSTAADISFSRTGTATAQMILSSLGFIDGTAGHGKVSIGLNPATISLFGSSSDTQALLNIGSFGGLPSLSMGAGGTTAPDISLVRTGALALQLTTSSVAMVDGTSGHGKLYLGLNAPTVQLFAASGDTQPGVTLGYFSGLSLIGLGPGGTTAQDVQLIRTGTAALQIGGKTTFVNGVVVNAQANPLTLKATTSGPASLTSNTDLVPTLYKGSGGTNYYALFAFNDGGTTRYLYANLHGATGTVTWTAGTSLPT